MNAILDLGDRGAELSDCGRYRFLLWRRWNKTRPRAVFIMLNPSTADATEDDPTIRRCIGFAKRWGYGGIRIANLFAFRATKPADLWKADDPVGSGNLPAIERAMETKGIHVAAWGADKRADRQAKRVRTLFYEMGIPLYALKLTKAGHPSHPLYLPNDSMPVVYEPARHALAVGDRWGRAA
ncbi:MAG: DUF1643 domain-containing protein [bacterium]